MKILGLNLKFKKSLLRISHIGGCRLPIYDGIIILFYRWLFLKLRKRILLVHFIRGCLRFNLYNIGRWYIITALGNGYGLSWTTWLQFNITSIFKRLHGLHFNKNVFETLIQWFFSIPIQFCYTHKSNQPDYSNQTCNFTWYSWCTPSSIINKRIYFATLVYPERDPSCISSSIHGISITKDRVEIKSIQKKKLKI